MLMRRLAFAAFALAAAGVSQGALARSNVPLGGVRVDVGPLRENAGDPTADWVAEALPAQLAQNLAARAASPNVSVRVEYLTLGSNSGALGPGGSSYDTIQGVATINGVETPVRATNSYYPMQVDQTMVEQSNRDRVAQLTAALAYWIAQDAH
jgi:hypothetical protein